MNNIKDDELDKFLESINKTTVTASIDEETLYKVACSCVESDMVSINSIQKEFLFGFSRANAIVDELERRGIISKKNSQTGKRKVLVNQEELDKMFLEKKEDFFFDNDECFLKNISSENREILKKYNLMKPLREMLKNQSTFSLDEVDYEKELEFGTIFGYIYGTFTFNEPLTLERLELAKGNINCIMSVNACSTFPASEVNNLISKVRNLAELDDLICGIEIDDSLKDGEFKILALFVYFPF